MKSTLIWIVLGGAILLFGGSADAWNRQFFNRFSRNIFQNSDLGKFPTQIHSAANGIDDYNGILHNAYVGSTAGGQQQSEVYGIVEPLIEDMPCVDRPCNINDDCCPTGVCVDTYGEGKCVYVYGRKRDLCHRNSDCDNGMDCTKGPNGNLICQLPFVTSQTKQFGENCETSSECNASKRLCCQLQRSHHRRLPKKVCSYFRDPFVCIDIITANDEGDGKSYVMSPFSQRLL